MIRSKSSTKVDVVLQSFVKLWSQIWGTPIHLDSALSKQPAHLKSILAQILPVILLKPASLAEALGVGVPPGEPWILKKEDLATWSPAKQMARRLYESMEKGKPNVVATAEDFPPHMIQEWESNWGPKTRHELVEALGKEAPLSLRANRVVGPEKLLAQLKAGAGLPVHVEQSRISPLGVRLSGYAPILNTELYRSGAFEIQDEGSQLMALFALWPERYGKVLKKQPGGVENLEMPPFLPDTVPTSWTVVDTCAGAGGKTLALADALKGRGRVYAYDISAKKLSALRRRATQAGLNNIQSVLVEEGKEAELVQRFKNSAQVVLVDAPCSGWGVLRRNPDIKWRQSADVLKRMPEIQNRLLKEYAELVAPGGRLVFGVCTFRLAETHDVITEFLKNDSRFKAEMGGFLGPNPCDGFFMQSLVRTEEGRNKS